MNRHPAAVLLLLIVSLVGTPILSVAAIAHGKGADQDHYFMMSADKSDLAHNCSQHIDIGNKAPATNHDDCAKQCCKNCAPVFSLFTIPSISLVQRSCNAVIGLVAPHKAYESDVHDRPPRFTF